MVSQQEMAGTARAGAARHPLDPLSSEEISQAVAIFRAGSRARPAMRFVSVSLHEPPKDELASIRPGQPFRREALIVALEPAEHLTYEAVVSVTEGSVLSWRAVPGVRAPITPGEYAASERLVRADPRFRAGLQGRGTEQPAQVLGAWGGTGTCGRGANGGRRLKWTVCSSRATPASTPT